MKVGREVQVLPWLHDLYTIANSLFSMTSSEASRLGILKRKLQIEQPTNFSTPAELVNLLDVEVQVACKLFRLVLEFARRFINDSYQITMYVNMARLLRAEQEVNELIREGEKFLKELNFLLVQNVCIAVHCGVQWLRRARQSIEYRKRREKMKKEEQDELNFN